MPDLTSSKGTFNRLYSIYSGNICCVNGSFEVEDSVNTDQTALTASHICDYNILPFHHYHLDSLSCLSK